MISDRTSQIQLLPVSNYLKCLHLRKKVDKRRIWKKTKSYIIDDGWAACWWWLSGFYLLPEQAAEAPGEWMRPETTPGHRCSSCESLQRCRVKTFENEARNCKVLERNNIQTYGHVFQDQPNSVWSNAGINVLKLIVVRKTTWYQTVVKHIFRYHFLTRNPSLKVNVTDGFING